MNRKEVLREFDSQRAWTDAYVADGIERFRKGDLVLQFYDRSMQPVQHVRVQAEQVDHDFNFGANLFMLDEFNTPEQNAHYRDITVAQIIERADIGRSTFYAHFETKDDLLEQMCVEMFDHIFEGVNEHCVTHADLRDTDLAGILAHLLYHMRDTHSGVCAKLLHEREPHFTAHFSEKLAVLFARKVCDMPQGVPADFAQSVLVASFIQAVSWWFSSNCTSTPEELAGWFLATLKIA